jgi:GT2 family glycosyltransferase
MSRTSKHVVVVVLNYCSEEDTAACIQSLSRSDYKPFSILIVDNASPDGSGQRLRDRFPDVNHLALETNGGYAAGNNRGIEWALGRGADYVMILNDDTVVAEDLITRMVSSAEETGTAIVVPQILYFDQPDKVWYAGGRHSTLRCMGQHIGENGPVDESTSGRTVTFACGCCVLVRADVFAEIGGFDEAFFMYVEDLEFSVRAQKSGYTMYYEPRARVLHRISPNGEPAPWQIIQRDVNRRALVGRHYSVLQRMVSRVWFYPTRFVHLLRYIVRCDWRRARAIVIGATRPANFRPRITLVAD